MSRRRTPLRGPIASHVRVTTSPVFRPAPRLMAVHTTALLSFPRAGGGSCRPHAANSQQEPLAVPPAPGSLAALAAPAALPLCLRMAVFTGSGTAPRALPDAGSSGTWHEPGGPVHTRLEVMAGVFAQPLIEQSGILNLLH